MIRTLGIIAAAFSVAVSIVMAGDSTNSRSSFLQPRSVVREKSSDVLSSQVRSFLSRRDGDTARVWVYFTDKGVRTPAEFEAAAASVVFTERAERRRVRTRSSQKLFVDLPVNQTYIDQLTGLGAVHRRSSRWLNAASFDVPFERLDELSVLPMVAEIRPIARFRRLEERSDTTPPDPAESQSGNLDYGESLFQIRQINAVSAHEHGLSGRGVTLTITDTGFRKTHESLAPHVAAGRVLAEYDFVKNDSNTSLEAGDPYNQWDHGTLVWSVAAGYAPGRIIGPAYNANFILCKTEDMASETAVEEDNWVAALEFADSVGTDVISTSLGYSDWYTYQDMNGQTAVISQAASTCDALGIVLVVAAGNEGPSQGTITAPADAFDILSAGAVDMSGLIASFSSRGPTFDGRIKPEVCALGVDDFGAFTSADNAYRYAGGTSLSTPLVAGAACLLIEARPDFTPRLVREALKGTAKYAANPNNTYGWGLLDVDSALLWPVNFACDSSQGQAPLAVSFRNNSWLEASELTWDFGDGETSNSPNPSHVFQYPGVYDVTLTIATAEGRFARTIPGMVLAHSDTLALSDVQAAPGSKVRVDVYARNFLPLDEIEIPFCWDGPLGMAFDSSSTAGLRTAAYTPVLLSLALSTKRATVLLRTSSAPAQPRLPPGSGSVLSIYFTMPSRSGPAYNPVSLVSYGKYAPTFRSGSYDYFPWVTAGSVRTGCCVGVVGDVDGDGSATTTLVDISRLIDCLFINRTPLDCWTEADADQSGGANAGPNDISIVDVAVLIDYLFIRGTALVLPDCP